MPQRSLLRHPDEGRTCPEATLPPAKPLRDRGTRLPQATRTMLSVDRTAQHLSRARPQAVPKDRRCRSGRRNCRPVRRRRIAVISR